MANDTTKNLIIEITIPQIEAAIAKITELNKQIEEIQNKSGQSTKATQDFGNAVKDAGDKFKEAAAGIKENSAAAQDNENKTASLRAQIRANTQQLGEMALSGEAGTQAYGKLAMETGRLKESMMNAQGSVKAFTHQTEVYLGGMKQGIGAVVGAFAIYQGVMGMCGVKNKELQETMMKLQSAMAVMMGLERVLVVFKKNSIFQQMLQNLQYRIAAFRINLATRAQVANTIATETGTIAARVSAAAWKALSIAMKSNWIIAIVAAVIAAAAALYGLIKKQQEYNAALNAAKTHSEKYVEWQKQIAAANRSANDSFTEEAVEMKILFTTAKNAIGNKKEYKQAIEAVNSAYGKYLPNLLTEKSTLNDIENAYRAVVMQLKLKLQYEIASETAKKSAVAAAQTQADIAGTNLQIQALQKLQKEMKSSAWENLSWQQELMSTYAWQMSIIKQTGVGSASVKPSIETVQKAVNILTQRVSTGQQEIIAYNSATDAAIAEAAKFKIKIDDETSAHKENTKTLKDAESALDKYNAKLKQLNELTLASQTKIGNKRAQITAEYSKELSDIDQFEKELYDLGVAANGKNFKLTQESLDQLAKLRENAHKKSIEDGTAAQKDEFDFNKKSEEEIQKWYEGIWKKHNDLEKQYYDLVIQTAKEGTQEKIDAEVELENFRYNEEVKKIKKEQKKYKEGTAEYLRYTQILELLEKQHEDNIAKIKQTAFKQLIDTHKQEIDAILNGLSQIANALGQYYDYKNAKEKASFDTFEKTQEDQRKVLQARLDAGTISQATYDARIAQLDEAKDKKKRQIDRDAAKRAKTMAIISATISGFDAALSAYAAGWKIDPSGISATIFSVVAAAFAALQIGLIAATPLPSAARGRLSRAPSHAANGEVIEVEGGEATLSKRATQRNLPYLDLFQRQAGGQPFINDNGYSAAMAANRLNGGASAADIAAALMQANFTVSVVDINKGQARVNVITNRAKI
jgi:uncharacterized protein (DUF433 family)